MNSINSSGSKWCNCVAIGRSHAFDFNRNNFVDCAHTWTCQAHDSYNGVVCELYARTKWKTKWHNRRIEPIHTRNTLGAGQKYFYEFSFDDLMLAKVRATVFSLIRQQRCQHTNRKCHIRNKFFTSKRKIGCTLHCIYDMGRAELFESVLEQRTFVLQF